MRTLFASLLIIIMVSFTPVLCRAENYNDDYIAKDGVIKDSDTAIKLAEIVLKSVYGKEEIEFQKPFVAELIDGVWIVSGTLPKGYKGGSPHIYISKEDGRIIRIFHDK